MAATKSKCYPCSECGKHKFSRAGVVCFWCRNGRPPAIAPIYIATKGRPAAPAFKALGNEGIPFTIVVEPQDEQAYADALPGVPRLVLPKNDQGLPYARQFIIEHARGVLPDDAWFWIIDDDTSGFATVEGKRCVPAPAVEVLSAAQDLAASVAGCAQASLEYRQYAWSATKDYTVDTFCDCVVLFHVGRTRGIDYRTDIKLKGDREYTLRLILAGRVVLRMHRLAFSSPRNGTNVGGLADTYAIDGAEREAAEAVVRSHPGLCKLNIKADGRPDVKFNWKAARKRAEAARDTMNLWLEG